MPEIFAPTGSGFRLGLARLPAILYFIFLLVLIQLPMEVPLPLISLGPLVFTNLEITLGILLAGFAVYGLLRSRRAEAAVTRSRTLSRPDILSPDLAVGLWILSLLVSAALAPDMRGHAAKFAVRSAAIAFLYVASRTFHGAGEQGERRLRITVATLAALGGTVSFLGILEGMKDYSIEPILSIFRTTPTLTADGFLRMTASFSHANQTGGFLVLILPLVAALALSARGRGRLVWIAATAVVLWGLLSTLSRSSVVAGVLATFLLLAVYLRPRRTRAAAALLIGVLCVLGAARWGADASFRSRFGGPPIASPFAARYEAPEELTLAAGMKTRIAVRARNDGSTSWNRGGFDPVRLSYHLVRMSDEKSVAFEGLRTPVPKTVPPGGAVVFPAEFRAPAETGRFLVVWDLARERVSWFSWAGVPPAMTRLTVLPADATSGAIDDRWTESAERLRQVAAHIESQVTWSEAPRRTLWGIALRLFQRRPLFGWGGDTFRLRYADFLEPGHWDPRIHANNVYLELLATTGIVGFLAWLWVLLTLAWRARRRILGERLPHGGTRGSILMIAACAALLAFSVQGLLDSFLEFYGIMGGFWILAGTIAGSRPSPRSGISSMSLLQ